MLCRSVPPLFALLLSLILYSRASTGGKERRVVVDPPAISSMICLAFFLGGGCSALCTLWFLSHAFLPCLSLPTYRVLGSRLFLLLHLIQASLVTTLLGLTFRVSTWHFLGFLSSSYPVCFLCRGQR